MSDLRNVEGVLLPEVGRGAPVTFKEQIRPNLSREQQKYMRTREKMIEKSLEDWDNDERRIG